MAPAIAGQCGAPDAPFVGMVPIGSGDPDGDDYFCDDCNREMMAMLFRVAEPEPPTQH